MGKRLLVVDDDPVVRFLLQECLAALGHDVLAIESAREGLSWLSTNHADLIIVDMIMPEMSGLELLKKIRALPDNQATPVILLSANADRKLATLDPEAKPDRIIEKPWDMQVLSEAIEQLSAAKSTESLT